MRTKLALSVALIAATMVGTIVSSYADPNPRNHSLGYTRDQSVNGG